MTDDQEPPAPPPPPPGWHTDPNDSTSLRYWDGMKWTEQRAPNPNALPAPTAGPRASGQGQAGWTNTRAIAAAGAAAIIAGSLSPWATATTGFGTISRNGTDSGGDGVFTLIGGAVILVLILLQKYTGATIIAGLTGAILVYDFYDVSNVDGIEVGWGLYVALGGAIAAFVTSLNLRNEQQRAQHPSKALVLPPEHQAYANSFGQLEPREQGFVLSYLRQAAECDRKAKTAKSAKSEKLAEQAESYRAMVRQLIPEFDPRQ